jgi:hypothetical protein
MRRAATLAALAGAALAPASSAAGQQQSVALPSTGIPLSPAPPLLSGISQVQPVYRGDLTSRERVTAHLDETGEVGAVDVLQRITVPTGDFFFAIPAPVVSVKPAKGSRSEPGLRPKEILWQGFSPGNRVLAADARLKVEQSAPFLPLGVSVHATVDGSPLTPGQRRDGALDIRIRLANRTAVRYRSFTAPARAADIARILDRARTLQAGNRGYAPYLQVETPVHPVNVSVRAPLLVEGTVSVPLRRLEDGRVAGGRTAKTTEGVRVRISRVLADGRPPILDVRIRGHAVAAGPPKLDLTVVPVAPTRALTPPEGRSWTALVRSGRAPGTDVLLARAQAGLLALARDSQYESYLQNPDGSGSSRASYRYVSGVPKATPALPPAPTERGGETAPWELVAFGLAALLAVSGLTVLWAHS